tara:strand:+ start:2607 stop:3035 length:429 start_codon:yes stop_codon:yes gene_type:complete
MAITQAMCSSFKQEILVGTHNFTASSGNAFKMSLYTSSATINATTTAYTSGNEASGTGYSSTGKAVVAVTPVLSGTTALVDFADLTWGSSSITARGALIYNDTQSDKAVIVLDFGSNKTSSSGDFTVQFPAADASNAIIRIT